MPPNNPSGYANAGWGWAIGTGGASAAVDATTDINPLLELTPSPWMAPLYGFGTLSPREGFRRLGSSVTWGSWQKKLGTKMEYGGAWGYKTLMTGVKSGSLASNLSLGNVVLSATEMAGKAVGGMFGVQNDAYIKAMSNARQGGLAKLFGEVQTGSSPATNRQKLNLYNKLKKKHKGTSSKFLRKQFKAQVGKIKGKTTTTATGFTKFMHWMGGETVKGGPAMINIGGKGFFQNAATRGAAGLSGVGTAMFLWDIFSLPINSVLDSAESGLTDLATSVMQWQRESVLPDFGHGRIPTAMTSSGAATERRRAIQAAYSAKINPGNRMFGNEARYHHQR